MNIKPTRLENLKKAVSKLVLFVSKKDASELDRAGVIQAFEFTYELL